MKAAVITSLSLWLMAVPIRAQEPRTSVREIASLAGTVERLDRSMRALTLRVADGVTQVVYVAPEVKIFDELKAGDSVTVRVTEEVIVATRPGLKPNAVVDTTADAKKSAVAQGDVVQQLKAVVTIENIDQRMQTVAYKGGNNQLVVRVVADPHLLDGLKRGDVIEITYTRQRAIDVQRRR